MLNKRWSFLLTALLAGAILLSACAQTATPAAQSNPSAPERSITVVGQGKASGTPDVAHINIGVDTSGASAQEAVNANRVQMTALLEKIKALGVAEKDIRTSNYSIYAERSEPQLKGESSTGSEAITYRVSNQVSVTVRDIAKLGDLLDQAVSAGANNIYGVSFEVADTSKLEAEAREKAIADARARAESLAKLSGVSVGDVLLISEVVGGVSPIYPRAAYEGLGAGTPIEPGEFQVSLSIQVTYAIQ